MSRLRSRTARPARFAFLLSGLLGLACSDDDADAPGNSSSGGAGEGGTWGAGGNGKVLGGSAGAGAGGPGSGGRAVSGAAGEGGAAAGEGGAAGDGGLGGHSGEAGQAGAASNGCSTLADASPCDDHDVCTTDDRCQSGECVGTAMLSDAKVLGRTSVFGRGPLLPTSGGSGPVQLSGLAALLTSDSALFLDLNSSGSTLRLSTVEIGGDALLPRAVLDSDESWGVSQVSWVFSQQPTTQVAALGPDRFVLDSQGRLTLYSLKAAQLSQLSRVATTGARALAVRANRLWSCSHKVENFHVDAKDSLVADGISEGEFGTCLSLVVSTDGTLLYGVGDRGIAEFAIGPVGTRVVYQRMLTALPAFAVGVSSDYFVVQQVQDSSALGDITVYRDSTLATQIALFDKWAPEGTPLGFALMANGIVIARSISNDGGRAVAAEYYELSSAGASLKSQLIVHERLAADDLGFLDGVRPIALGSHVILQPSRRVLRLNATTGTLTEVSGPRQGHLEALTASGAHDALNSAADSAHLIDLSDPSSPIVKAGGLMAADVQPLQLLLPEQRGAVPKLGPERLLTAEDDQLSLVQERAGSAPEFVRSIPIHGGPALLLQGARALIGFKKSTREHSAVVMEFPLAAVQDGPFAVEELNPSFEQDLGIDATSAFTDATADQLFVTSPGAGTPRSLVVNRYRRGVDEQWMPAGELSLPGSFAQGIAASGHAALVIDSRELVLLATNTRFEQVAALSASEADLLGAPLRLTEQELDVAVGSPRSGLTVLGVPNLNLVTNYELPDMPLSVAQVGNTVLAATGNQVFALSPKCPFESQSAECPTPGERKCANAHEVQSCSAATGKWETILSCADTCQAGDCLSVRAVEVGHRHSCAQISDQSIRCWGERGLLGARLAPSSAEPAAGPITVLDEDGAAPLVARQIALGTRHSCAVDPSGSVKCWGLSMYGALGNGILTGNTPADVHPALNQDLSPIAGALGVAAGGHSTCVVLADHTVSCFGRGSEGQLGDNRLGPTANRGVAGPVLDPELPAEPLRNVTQVAVGYLHACALLAAGNVRCWGNDEIGQLGNHHSGVGLKSALPEVVLAATGNAELSDVQKLSAGYTHTCALLVDHTAYCWGEGVNGELGPALAAGQTHSDVALPIVNANGKPLQEIESIQAGWGITCLVMRDSSAKCFGSGRRGERADGVLSTANYGSEPTVVLDDNLHPALGIAQMAAGFHSSCARDAQSGLACAGSNLSEFVFGSNASVLSQVRW